MADKNLHVAAAIIARDNKVLAARRKHGMEGWELPGGKLEPGESAEDACRREISEELAWLGRDELLSVDWLPADLDVVKSFGFAWADVFNDMHM